MSYTVLLCPSCASEVRTRPIAGQRSRGMITCESCGESFNLHEFNPKREITTHAYLGGLGSEFPLTLRPSGVYGDQSDATFNTIDDGGTSGTILTGFTSSNIGGTFDSDPAAVDFYIRASTSADPAGGIPQVSVKFRQGAAGTQRTAGSTASVDLVGTIANYGPFTITTDQSGAPWTANTVKQIRVSGQAVTNDGGIGAVTVLNTYEIWLVLR